MMRRRSSWFVAVVALAATAGIGPVDAAGQIEFSGQLDLVGVARGDGPELNQGFRGDGPFNAVRLKLFARRWVTDRIGIFAELLYDVDAAARVNGAYVVVNDLMGGPWLNARLGLAPNVVGSFGQRSTYFNVNPLIGVPLVWSYRTNLGGSGTNTAAGLTTATGEPGGGMPILYDSCWNVQWELLGEIGRFEYSVGMTPGSMSNPIRSRAVKGSTWMARVGFAPVPSVRLGLSAAEGPYLSAPTLDAAGNPPYAEDPSDFDQRLHGVDVAYQAGSWLVHSEAYRVVWEAPLVSDDLEAFGGYVELRFDFLPGWYVAGRLDGLQFSDIATGPQAGTRAPWDQDTRRTEVALGYRLAREVLLKLDWQRTTIPDAGFGQNRFAVQVSSVF